MKRMFAVLVGVLLVAAACTSSSDDTTTTAAVADTTTTTTVATTTASVPTGSGSVWLAADAQQQLGLGIEESVGIPTAVLPVLESVDVGNLSSASVLNIDVAVITPVGMYLPETGVEIPEGENGCMIAKASVVVLTADLDAVDRADNGLDDNSVGPVPATVQQFGPPLEDNEGGELQFVAPVEVADLTLVQVPLGRDALGYVVDLLAEGIPAWPHYAVNLGARWKYGPATVPIPVPSSAPLPSLTASQGGQTVTVIDAFGMNAQGVAAGHGKFVVGILKRLGVLAKEVSAQFYGSPISSEMEIANLITPGINNLSLGTDACFVQEGADLRDGEGLHTIPDLNGDDDTNDILALPPIVLARAIIDKSAFVVAAAGNDSVTGETCLRPWVPAAYADFDLYFPPNSLPDVIEDQYAGVADKVVSVGASGNPDVENRASFSNCGGSTVFAPGIGIISDHLQMGSAVWSGSSFATPIIAGLIARGEISP